MIQDEEAERAVDFLRDSAEKAACARAERAFAEEYRKSMKALIMSHHEGSVALQERNAYSDPKYIAHLEAIRAAVFQDELMRSQREAAQAKIQAWQTQSANLRGSRPLV